MKFDLKRYFSFLSKRKADLFQKLGNKKFIRNSITLFIGFLSFSLVFNSIFVISPSKGSNNSDLNGAIPTLEHDVSTRGVLSIEEMREGEVIAYYYVNINQTDIYELRLTLPPEVFNVRVEFRYLKENEFNNKELKYIDNLYFEGIGDDYPPRDITISRYIPLLKDEYLGTIGLTFFFYTVQDPDRDQRYYIRFFRATTEARHQFNVGLTPENPDFSRIFILDLPSLGVTTAGFYSLYTLLEVDVTDSDSIDYFWGNSDIKCLNEEIDLSDYYYWDFYNYEEFSQENNFILYIDPSQEYLFQTNNHLWPDNNEQIEITINFAFALGALISQALPINGSTTIPNDNPTLVEIEIPERDSVRVIFQHYSLFNYKVEIRNQASVRYSREFYYNLDDNDDSYYYYRYSVSHIQLAKRDIDSSLIGFSGFPEETTQIAFGGLAIRYIYERTYRDNCRYRHRVETYPIEIPLLGVNDSVYFLIESSEPLSLQSRIETVGSRSTSNETIDIVEDPIQMFEINAGVDDLFTFENEQNLEVQEPAIANAVDFDHSDFSQLTISTETKCFLPGNPSFLSGSNENYIQQGSMRTGKGVLVYYGYCYISYYGYLTGERDVIIPESEIRVPFEATVETNVKKGSIPQVGKAIEINTSGIHWFLFPVEKNKIYTISVEGRPFSTSFNARIIDIYGNNPLIGQNDYIRMSDYNNVFIGKRTVKSYLILEGEGLVRITIENSSIDYGWILPPTTIFGILLLLGITTVLFRKRLFPT